MSTTAASKYAGVDSRGPIRVRVDMGGHPKNIYHKGPYSPFHEISHYHIDRKVNGQTGSWFSTYVGSWRDLY